MRSLLMPWRSSREHPPIDLLALESREAFEAKRLWDPGGNGWKSGTNQDPPADPASPRTRTMAIWAQVVQDSEPPADSDLGWSRILIPPALLGQCMNRPHGEVSFRLTNKLTHTVVSTGIYTGSPCVFVRVFSLWTSRIKHRWGGQCLPHSRPL